MSVINQMLKDLDGRQSDQTSVNSTLEGERGNSKGKNSLTLIFLALILLVLVIIAWQLIAQQTEQVSSSSNHTEAKTPVVKSSSTSRTAFEKESVTSSAIIDAKSNHVPSTTEGHSNLTMSPEMRKSPESNVIQDIKSEEKQSKQTPVKARLQAVKVSSSVEQSRVAKPQVPENSDKTTESELQVEPSLSISHKKLSPKALVAQKMQRVEININEGNTQKAESLLEEILLIEPEHDIARKQLAALWFGRQDYNAAHNLLAQGINLKPAYPEFRLMKARIYLKENKVEQAVNSLLPLSGTDSVEYQSVLATAAQQIKRHNVAIDAFKRLTALEPSKGRWWLGVGASLDSQGEFEQAKLAYRQALMTSSLSDNAQQFIRQRLTALGE